MDVNAQWIFPSLVLQQGQVLQIQSCSHIHGFFFWPHQAPAKCSAQGGRHLCAFESAAFELRREAALSQHVSPLSWRLATSCMAGEIKRRSESCCCLGWGRSLKQGCVVQGRRCRLGTVGPQSHPGLTKAFWANYWASPSLSLPTCEMQQLPCCIVVQNKWDLHVSHLAHSMPCRFFSLHDYFPTFFVDFPILTLNFPQRSSLYHWKGDDHSFPNRSVNPFTFCPGPLQPKGLLCGSWALTHRSSLPLSQSMCIPWKLHPLF